MFGNQNWLEFKVLNLVGNKGDFKLLSTAIKASKNLEGWDYLRWLSSILNNYWMRFFCDDIRKSQSGHARVFTRGFRFPNPDCVEPGEYLGIHRKLFRCAIEASKCSSSMNNSLREQKWISSYSGAKFSLYVTSFCRDFVALTWYLCFQCLRWRITFRKFTKNSTTKASKQERYDLVFALLTCCDFT